MKDDQNETDALTDGSGESGSDDERQLAPTQLTTETAQEKIAAAMDSDEEKYTEEEGRKASLVLQSSQSDLEDEIKMDRSGVDGETASASKPRIIGSEPAAAAQGDVRRFFEPHFVVVVAAAAVIATVAAVSGAAAALALWCLLSPSSSSREEEVLGFCSLRISTEQNFFSQKVTNCSGN